MSARHFMAWSLTEAEIGPKSGDVMCSAFVSSTPARAIYFIFKQSGYFPPCPSGPSHFAARHGETVRPWPRLLRKSSLSFFLSFWETDRVETRFAVPMLSFTMATESGSPGRRQSHLLCCAENTQ
jgi:hypothetical protein